jgi:leader peptidase (prepilin peptidase)/N-methyltransferase
MFIFYLIIIGLCLGSFLNVVIYRLPDGKSVVSPGSRCMGCMSEIKWYDNIPLLSYFFLRGKCRFCKTQISIQYPLIELGTALLMLVTWLKFRDLPLFLIFSLLGLLLIPIIVIDYKLRIIPDELSVLMIITGILLSPFNTLIGPSVWARLLNSVIGTVVGIGFFYVVAEVGAKILKKEEGVLGGGDIKLVGGFGAYLSWHGLFYSVFIGSLIGTLTGLVLIYIVKNKKWGDYLPTAHFCVLALYYIIF